MAAKELLDFGFNEDKNKKEKGKETNNDNSKKKGPKKPTRKFLLKVSNFPPVAMGAWNWFYPAVSKGMEQNNVELEAVKGEKELSCSLKSYKKKGFSSSPPWFWRSLERGRALVWIPPGSRIFQGWRERSSADLKFQGSWSWDARWLLG